MCSIHNPYYYFSYYHYHHPQTQWINKGNTGTSLAVQWLRFWAFTAGGTLPIPGWGTKILHAVRCSQKIIKIKNKQNKTKQKTKGNTYHQYRDHEKVLKKGSFLRLWDPILTVTQFPSGFSLAPSPLGESVGRWKRKTIASPWGKAPIAGFKVTTAFPHRYRVVGLTQCFLAPGSPYKQLAV